MMDISQFKRQLIEHEDLRTLPYRDTVGKLTIGVGRNLTDNGISRSEALHLLANDVDEVVNGLDARIPWWRELDDVRQLALADMVFNMGLEKIISGWQNTLKLIAAGAWVDAARAIRKSKYARQTGRRARRIANMIETGEDQGLEA